MTSTGVQCRNSPPPAKFSVVSILQEIPSSIAWIVVPRSLSFLPLIWSLSRARVFFLLPICRPREKKCAAEAARVMMYLLLTDYIIHDFSGIIVHCLRTMDVDICCCLRTGMTDSYLNCFGIYVIFCHSSCTGVS